MKKERLILGVVIFTIGFIGILSILTMNIPLPEEASKILLKQFTPNQIKLLILINPTIMLMGAVLLGLFMHEKVALDIPIIKGIIKNDTHYQISSILKYGIIGGVISGVMLTLIGMVFYPMLPLEFIELAGTLKPTLLARFLYGGLTEEILMRFGLMSFVIWLLSKIFKTINTKIYWIGILIAAVLFALGHFPIAFQAVSNPSGLLLSYILIGNLIGGVIFGWLYWKKGLETACIAHIFTHIVMVLGESLINTV